MNKKLPKSQRARRLRKFYLVGAIAGPSVGVSDGVPVVLGVAVGVTDGMISAKVGVGGTLTSVTLGASIPITITSTTASPKRASVRDDDR